MVGDMEVAQATTTALRLGAGLAWDLVPAWPRGPLGVSLALGGGVVRHGLDRRAVGLPPIHGARWIGVGAARAELAWSLAPQLAAVASLGVEVASGATRVVIDGEVVETIPALRGVAGLGFRMIF